jgi:hypothetical protein
VKRIAATMGYEAIVDDEDFEYLSRYKWYAHSNLGGNHRPARRTKVREGRKVRFLVHHIMPPREGLVVDHINGDPWDNRRANLRYCTHEQNMRNRKKHGGSCKAPYKGVARVGRRFRAAIQAGGPQIIVYGFQTAEEAAREYDRLALQLHGEFARLNFPSSAA